MLPAHLRQSLEAPIAALRASIDELEHEFGEEDERSQRLHRAGELVDNLRTCVEALVDLTSSEEAGCVLPCSLEELGRTALRRLPSPLAAGIQLALEPDSPAVEVDGPAFTRALAFLIQAQVPAGSEALLHGSVVQDEVRFTLMSGPHEEPTNKAGGELLRVAASHDLTRLGGSIETRPSDRGPWLAAVRLPLTRGGR